MFSGTMVMVLGSSSAARRVSWTPENYGISARDLRGQRDRTWRPAGQVLVPAARSARRIDRVPAQDVDDVAGCAAAIVLELHPALQHLLGPYRCGQIHDAVCVRGRCDRECERRE